MKINVNINDGQTQSLSTSLADLVKRLHSMISEC